MAEVLDEFDKGAGLALFADADDRGLHLHAGPVSAYFFLISSAQKERLACRKPITVASA